MARTTRGNRLTGASVGRSAAAPPAAPVPSDRERQVYPVWRWRTFPVFVALGVGLLVGSFSGSPENDLNIALRVLAVFMIAYALIHMFVMNVVVAARIKRRHETIVRGEVPEEDWEDEVLHTDR